MTIESAGGKKKYRQDPENKCMVQVQHKFGGNWYDYAPRDSEKEAKELVWQLSSDPRARPTYHDAATGNATGEGGSK